MLLKLAGESGFRAIKGYCYSQCKRNGHMCTHWLADHCLGGQTQAAACRHASFQAHQLSHLTHTQHRWQNCW